MDTNLEPEITNSGAERWKQGTQERGGRMSKDVNTVNHSVGKGIGPPGSNLLPFQRRDYDFWAGEVLKYLSMGVAQALVRVDACRMPAVETSVLIL